MIHMPENLFAACRVGGDLVAKRVRLNADVQDQVEGVFAQQSQSFFEGKDEEVAFDGRWKPDTNQLLTVEATDEALLLRNTLALNAVAVPGLNVANFANEGIKALFTGQVANGSDRVLVQSFTGGQLLGRKFPLILAGNSFTRLTAPAFVLGTSLTFVIEASLIKFKSFATLRSILQVLEIYREATDPEVRDFAGHPRLMVADLEDFVLSADQVTRKLVNAVVASEVLDTYSPTDIKTAAKATQLEIELQNGKIVMPSGRREMKDLLQFLDESRYSGPLSGLPYVTNSRRPVQA